MLKLKHSYHLDFPHMTFHVPHVMHLSPVMADDDELTAAIVHDPIELDNNTELVLRYLDVQLIPNCYQAQSGHAR